ncbi:hypothetical protein C8F01DRAFT_1092587 [Mycena amicta]|nr:hypothetical protein C8F01DRAFT_1092587 [Mycena amicta]
MAAEKKRESEKEYPGHSLQASSSSSRLLVFLSQIISIPPPPGPCQTIQIPDVYAGGYHTYSPFTVSSSPPTNRDFSLPPMIMALASTNTSGFDYLPAAGEAGNTMSSFEANLMTSDFLRSMITSPTPKDVQASEHEYRAAQQRARLGIGRVRLRRTRRCATSCARCSPTRLPAEPELAIATCRKSLSAVWTSTPSNADLAYSTVFGHHHNVFIQNFNLKNSQLSTES